MNISDQKKCKMAMQPRKIFIKPVVKLGRLDQVGYDQWCAYKTAFQKYLYHLLIFVS